MANRWVARGGLEERCAGGLHIPPPSAAWVWDVRQCVEAALGAEREAARQGCERLYHTVRARSVRLRDTGWRVDQVLMAVKQDVAACVDVVTTSVDVADTSRVPALLDAVVRWCAGVFHIGN
jgi:hypothetical protein